MSSRPDRVPLIRLLLTALLITVATPGIKAQETPDKIVWEVGTSLNCGSGTFAPYYISALTHGTVTQSKGWMLNAGIRHDIDTTRRFSWGAGIQLYTTAASSTEYIKYLSGGDKAQNKMRPSAFRVQQLYATIKYRGMFLELGMKERGSFLLDNSLTSGDWVESGNARPIPQVRLGFINFQDIPFTHGLVQIQGELAYGKFTDNVWLKDFYSYGTSHINLGSYYLYRRLYLRSSQTLNFSLTLGIQAAGQIGGETQWWKRGELIREESFKLSAWKLLTSIIPHEYGTGRDEYFNGNNLGAWDILARYKIPGGNGIMKAYLQKPWEKGRSIAWQNGWDGLWGIEYDFPTSSRYLEAILLEYIYLLNQSGPVHYAPHDFPGSSITTNVTGRDDYYNNVEYNSYANYGVGIGSPFLKAPLYNTDGYPQYTSNLVKGFHLAAKGRISGWLRWKVALSYRRAYGNGTMPSIKPYDDLSWLLQIEGRWPNLEKLRFKIQAAADHGNYLGNNFGILCAISYHGDFTFQPK